MSFNDVWTGAVSFDWNTASNWNVGSSPATAPPTSNDTATINAAAGTDTVTGTGSLQSATLTLSSSGAGSVNLTGSFYTGYNAGALNLTGLVQLSGAIYDYGAAAFANNATLSGGAITVVGAATFGSAFTLKNGALNLSTASTATLTTLTLVGAAALSGDITTTALSDASATSLTLGTGVFDVSGSSATSPALLPALTINGYATLVGVFNSASNPAPSLTLLAGADLILNTGDALTAATATFNTSGTVSLTDGDLTVTGNASFGSYLTVTGAGSFTVDGTLTTNNGTINASNSSRVEIGALNGASGGLTLYADATSTIEIGGGNVGAAGSITIDTGVSFTESGYFSAPVIVVNGTVTVAANTALKLQGTSTSRGLTGSGAIDIDQGAALTVYNVDPGTSDLVTIDFAQLGGQLWLPSGDLDALGNFRPVITGFGATDVIEYYGTATSASYAANYLSLFNGANLVAKFNIGGGYAGDAFSTVAIAGGYTQVDLAGTPKVATAGTTSADSYTWVGPVAGYWNATANWDDTSAGQNPAAVAPGTHDLVTIAAAANGAAQVVIGNGNAYALTLGGETLLEGQFNVAAGGLSLTTSASLVLYTGSALNITGAAAFANYAGATLNGGALKVSGALSAAYATSFLLENGGSVTAGSLVDYYSNYTVDAGSTLTVTGGVSDNPQGGSSFTVNGGAMKVGGYFTSSNDAIYAQNGGTVQLKAVAEDTNKNGVTLEVYDATSSIELGAAGGVAAGTITVDSGVVVNERGTLYAPTIDVKGTLNVGAAQTMNVDGVLEDQGAVTVGAGGALTVSGALQLSANVTIYGGGLLTQNGAITGAGTVTIDAAAKLSVNANAPSASTVKVAFNGAGAVLALNTSDLDSAKAFDPGITGFNATDVIDFTDYSATITAAHYAAGALNLYSGSTIVATLNLTGTYTDTFSVLPVSGGTYQVDYLGGGTGAAPAGTTTADSYTWIGPVAGDWKTTGDWDDVTAGQNPATLAPGTHDLVTIAAAAGGAAQVIIGNGNAYALTLDGETLLDGVFNVAAGGLSLAQSASAYLYGGSTLTITGAGATFANYAGATLNGGALKVSGALSAAYATSFLLENGGSVTAGSLVDYYSNYTVDAGSTLTVTGGVSDNPQGGSSFTVNGGAMKVGGYFTSSNDAIYAQNGGTVQLKAVAEDTNKYGVTLEVYDATSSIELGAAGGVAAGTITVDSGVVVNERGTLYAPTIDVKGTLNVGAAQTMNVDGVLEDQGAVTVGAGGALTVSGALQLSANVTIYGGGLLTQNGAITGAGTVMIDAAAKLSVNANAPSASTVKVAFNGAGAVLALNTSDLDSAKAFDPGITGFNATDVIDFTDYSATITAAHYAAGALNLYSGSTIVATLNLTGTYTDTFSVLPVSGGTYQIDYLGGGTGAAPAGTTTADSYTWIGPVAGDWKTTGDWDDVTAGQNPATLAPGTHDLVTIAAAAGGAAQVIIGNGNAYALTLDGETLLDGVFNVAAGGLSLAQSASAYLYGGSTLTITGAGATFANYAGATLNGGALKVSGALSAAYATSFLLENGGSVTAGSLVDYYSNYTVDAGSTLTVTGGVSDNPQGGSSFTVNGGAMKVGGYFTSSNDAIYAQNGGTVQLKAVAEDTNKYGVTLEVYDATSSIELGAAGGVAAGTITVDSGVVVNERGTLDAPTIDVKGTLNVGAAQSMNVNGALEVDGVVNIVAGGQLTQNGAITGAGKISIGAGSKLSVNSDAGGSAVQIAFAGADGQLAINSGDLNTSNVFVPSLTGFGATDVIDFSYSTPITAATYAAGELSLYAGATVVATLNLTGTYANYFSVVSLNGGSTYQINYEGGAPKPAPPAGTTTGDTFQWIGPVAGFWSTTTNWDDTTQGQDPAAVAPGAEDSVTVAAAANGEAQVIDGAGNAYGLTLEGETLLQGVFKVLGTGARGGLTVASSASVVLYTASSLTISGDATFSNYGDATLNGGAMKVSGTMYGGYGSSFIIENGGALTMSQIVDYYSNYTVLAGGVVTDSGNASDNGGGSGGSSYTANGGSFTVKGIFVTTSDAVYAQNGGKVQLAAMQEDVHTNGVTLDVYDATSSIEIGTAGGAAGGAITLDAGVSVTESGNFYATTIVDNGALTVGAGQTLTMTGSLGGTGSVTIDASSTLIVYGATASGTDTIAFSGAGGTLELPDYYGLPKGMTLTGWVAGENLDVRGVTDAAYVSGSLVLYGNGATVGSFKVGASYAGDSFNVVALNNGYSQITLGPSWLNTAGGNFATAANWTTNTVPGSSDSAAISTSGAYTVSVTSSTTVRSIEETDSGATLNIGGGDTLTLLGASNINGAVAGTGTLALTGGITQFDGAGSISVSTWQLSGAGTNVTLDQALSYSGSFQAGSGTSATVSGGNLTLTGPAGFTNATVNGADTLFSGGATTVAILNIGGTATFDDTGALTQSGGAVTVGDATASASELVVASTGSWDILDNSGINRGFSTASSIVNNGLFEKTAGTGTSAIAPAFSNAHNILVSSGTLDFQAAVSGTGTDTIQGSSTILEFDSTLATGQTVDFSGANETLNLTDALGYGGSQIGAFIAGDNVDLNGSWSFSSFNENAGGTLGTLTLASGGNMIALEFAGSFTQSSFSINTGGTTVVGHT